MGYFILNCIIGSILIGSVAGVSAGQTPPRTPKVGDKAPPVQGTDQEGHAWKLEDAIAKGPVLLYFYPKDDTPGCTKEACGLRDRMDELKKQNVQVIGVSFDPASRHQEFIKKYSLNFPLLVDTQGEIADAFGARVEGRNMARRVSFLIDRNGVIQHVTDNPSADVHLTEMKEAVATLADKRH